MPRFDFYLSGIFTDNNTIKIKDTNGKRLETYAIPGKRGSGVIGLNGAAVHMASVGDRVIIFSFCQVPGEETASHRAMVAVLDENNKPVGGLRTL